MITPARLIKFTTAFAFALLTFCAMAQSNISNRPHLSAGAKQYLWKLDHEATERPYVYNGYVYHTDAQNNVYVNAIIKVQPGFTGDALEELGVHINTKADNIWTAKVPVENIRSFMYVSGIQYIEMDQPMYTMMDSARVATHVDSVHGGYGLPQPYTGKGVVMGIIDAGFDYTHPSLYDTAYNTYRVKRVWEQKTAGTPPAGFINGAEYADSAAIHAKMYDIYEGSHGAHVAGIAAGSGYGGDATHMHLRGMAYNSELALVAIYPALNHWVNSGLTDMMDGLNYIYNYAASVGKPAIVNLSWGGPIGPKDGNSLFSQALDNLTGPGKIFTVSAGNNGQNKVHVSKTFTANDISLNTFVTFSSGLPEPRNLVDVWGDSSENFYMRYSLYNNNTRTDSSALISLDENTHFIQLVGSDGDTCFITVTTVSNEFNGRPHMLLDIYSKTSNRLCLNVTATSGTVNMWQGYVLKTSGYYGTFTKYTYPWATNGDLIMQTSDMVSSRTAIGVAAYNSKVSFVNVNGNTQNYTGYTRGNIASFSSHGPTTDGRTKPDIAGPGMALASAVNSLDSALLPGGAERSLVAADFVSPRNGKTYSYAMFQGTSMSSPAVAGVIALLLEINPNLTPATIMDILKQTAITDNFTGTIPQEGSTTWGYGKVNAYAAVKKALETTGIFHQPSALACMLYPNPGAGNYQLQYTAAKNEELTLTLYNQTGSQLNTTHWQTTTGLNQYNLDLSNNPAGIYMVHINSASGSALIKVVKQ
ncbi:MAG TPA: S8/S53 family peptidase [Chitinophagales bacterium]|nr:S8/S53 family peptidase [Chitinophagales bacterium]